MAHAVKAVTLDKDATVFCQLKSILRGYNVDSVAAEADVAPATLYFWLAGKTKHPRVDTLTKTARVLGYDIRLHLTHQARARRQLTLVKS